LAAWRENGQGYFSRRAAKTAEVFSFSAPPASWRKTFYPQIIRRRTFSGRPREAAAKIVKMTKIKTEVTFPVFFHGGVIFTRMLKAVSASLVYCSNVFKNLLSIQVMNASVK